MALNSPSLYPWWKITQTPFQCYTFSYSLPSIITPVKVFTLTDTKTNESRPESLVTMLNGPLSIGGWSMSLNMRHVLSLVCLSTEYLHLLTYIEGEYCLRVLVFGNLDPTEKCVDSDVLYTVF